MFKLLSCFIKYFRLKLLILLAIYVAFSIVISSISISNQPLESRNDIYTPVDNQSLTESLESYPNFRLGVDISNVYDIDLDSRSFLADGWVYLKWTELPNWLKDWNPASYSDPARTIRFANAIRKSNFEKEIIPSFPYLDSDGYYIQWVRFSGAFYIDRLDLRRFPFHNLVLPVEIQLDDFSAGEVDITVDANDSHLIGGREFTGYHFVSDLLSHTIRTYQSSFGLIRSSAIELPNTSKSDNIRLNILLRKEFSSSFFLVFVPLIAALVVTFSTPLIHPKHYDTKVALPASVLLVLVFLQQGYQSMIPASLEYLTFADTIYSLAIFITISTFVWSLISSNKYLETGSFDNAILAIKASDRVFCVINICYVGILVPVFWSSLP